MGKSWCSTVELGEIRCYYIEKLVNGEEEGADGSLVASEPK